MTDDQRWFWASESGRDQILREQIDDLHANLSTSRRHSDRLSSQLAKVTGSLEHRLNALSVAFDAYVELGDIREELAAYPDTTQIRREVRDALVACVAGRAVAPVSPRGLDYWLAYATNAVLAIAAGTPDDTAERTARSLSPDSELFIVAACGLTGHGTAVADRVPPLLVCDAALAPAQVVVWEAVVDGRYGVEVLSSIEAIWRPALEIDDQDDWVRWVSDQAGPGSTATLDWLAVHTVAAGAEPTAETEPSESDGSRDGLRALVTELAGQGLGPEIALLQRSRELRARLENPTARPVVDDPDAQDATEPIGSTVTEAVRRGLLTTAGEPQRSVILGWVRPGLRLVTDHHEQRLASAQVVTMDVERPEGRVPVTPNGPEPTALAEVEAKIKASYTVSPLPFQLSAAGSAVLAVLVVVLAVLGQPGPALLLGVGCIGAAVVAIRQFRRRRDAALTGTAELAELHGRVRQAQAEAHNREDTRQADLRRAGELAATIRARLDAAADSAESVTAS